MGNPVTIQSFAKIDTRKEFDQVWKCKDPLGGGWIETGPIPNMLF